MAKLSRYSRPQQLLMHILEQPGLVRAVQTLEPEALTKLIRRIGLEDSGELVALFTPEQLMDVFDEDLWQSDRPGEEETFDDKRFALWLEVLLESGPGFAARKVAEMDEDLLTLALSRHIFVIDIDEMATRLANHEHNDDDDLLEKELDSWLYQEFEEFRAMSRNHRTWEPIRALLVELDGEHHEYLTRLLERCCHISRDYIEENGGLYEVLSSEEMVEADVAGAREERREQKGYVPPASATSFLTHARIESLDALLASSEVDPITRAHFRTAAAGPRSKPVPVPRTAEQAESASLLRKVLQDADVLEPTKALPLLGAETGDAPESVGNDLMVARAMRLLRERDEAAYAQRLNEMAYLSNVMLAGCEYDGREMRPLEAAQAALATCNLGAERLLRIGETPPREHEVGRLATQLAQTSLVKLFRIGWHVLYREVVVPSAEALHRLLDKAAGKRTATPAARAATVLANELRAGKPWRAIPRIGAATTILDERSLSPLLSLMQQLPLAWRDARGAARDTGLLEDHRQLHAARRWIDAQSAPKKRGKNLDLR